MDQYDIEMEKYNLIIDKLNKLISIKQKEFYVVSTNTVINNELWSSYFLKKYYREDRTILTNWLIEFYDEIKDYISLLKKLNDESKISTLIDHVELSFGGLQNIKLTYENDTKISEIIDNLILNFKKFMEENKTVHLQNKKTVLGLLMSTNSYQNFLKLSIKNLHL